MTHQQFLNVMDGWKNRTWTSPRNNQTIDVDYRVRCLTDYYGEGCDRYCRARNDMFGHYQCGDNGEVICLDGWTGVYCEKRKLPIKILLSTLITLIGSASLRRLSLHSVSQSCNVPFHTSLTSISNYISTLTTSTKQALL